MWEAEMRFMDKNGEVEKNMKNVIGNTSFMRTKKLGSDNSERNE